MSLPPIEPFAAQGLYVFCIGRATAPGPALPEFVMGSPLRPIIEHALVAWVCTVPLSDWVGERGEANLKDLKWLGPRAISHEQLIEQVMELGPVLPLRFGSIFSNEASLRTWLMQNRAAIADHLARIGDKKEWSIKGWLHPQRAISALAVNDARWQALPPSPGARYLREQKLKQELAREAREWGRRAGQTLLEQLRPFYEEERTLNVLPGPQAGTEEEAVFHFTLLVPACHLAALHGEVDRMNEEFLARGLSMTLTGPWPPYSFSPKLAAEPLSKPAAS